MQSNRDNAGRYTIRRNANNEQIAVGNCPNICEHTLSSTLKDRQPTNRFSVRPTEGNCSTDNFGVCSCHLLTLADTFTPDSSPVAVFLRFLLVKLYISQCKATSQLAQFWDRGLALTYACRTPAQMLHHTTFPPLHSASLIKCLELIAPSSHRGLTPSVPQAYSPLSQLPKDGNLWKQRRMTKLRQGPRRLDACNSSSCGLRYVDTQSKA